MEKNIKSGSNTAAEKNKPCISFLSNHSRREFLGSVPVLCGGLAFLQVTRNDGAMEDKSETPLVKIPKQSIYMRHPEPALYGITDDEKVGITLSEVIKVHGFCVGGATFSFRAAKEAFLVLYGDKLPVRHKIQVQTSYHCCQAAALAYITGARTDYGAFHSHGNLILLPEEEKKIVFIDKPSARTVTLQPLFNPHDTFRPLFQKTKKDPEFAFQVSMMMNEKIEEYLTLPREKLFIVED